MTIRHHELLYSNNTGKDRCNSKTMVLVKPCVGYNFWTLFFQWSCDTKEDVLLLFLHFYWFLLFLTLIFFLSSKFYLMLFSVQRTKTYYLFSALSGFRVALDYFPYFSSNSLLSLLIFDTLFGIEEKITNSFYQI